MSKMVDIEYFQKKLASLAIYKNFLADNTGLKFALLLNAINEKDDFLNVLEIYSDFVSDLYSSDCMGDWSKYVRDFVLSDKNVVSINCAKNNLKQIPEFVMTTFENELKTLSELASVSFEDIKNSILVMYPNKLNETNSNMLAKFDSYKLLFTKEQVINSYKTIGYGLLSKFYAFKLDNNLNIVPVYEPDKITLSDLKLYDFQKEAVKNNTISFIKGQKANNILLYGDRGCGKSSLVKAILNEYKNLGLKVIQVTKNNISSLEELYEQLSVLPSKFIIFLDDLVFDENDPQFASAKAVLEGSLAKNPDNVLIYATTNRRHIVKESFTSREGSEVHLNDTMDEAASLSDRFGVTITFSSPDKKDYLEIVRRLADEIGLEYEETKLFREAEAYALLKGNRAPRVARQFLVNYKNSL